MRDNLFFDTSAIAKRYVTETGSEWGKIQCEPATGNTIILSHATLVEAVAAFCRKARQQDFSQRISETDRDRHIKLFRQDAEEQYYVIRVTKPICLRAGNLCRSYKLRAYDAVQLATALIMNERLIIDRRTSLIFVSADVDLLNVAEAEGLDIQNPNAYS